VCARGIVPYMFLTRRGRNVSVTIVTEIVGQLSWPFSKSKRFYSLRKSRSLCENDESNLKGLFLGFRASSDDASDDRCCQTEQLADF